MPSFAYVFVVALKELNGERVNTDYGVNEIPWKAKYDYALAHEVENLDQFLDILSTADLVYVDGANKKIMTTVEQNGRRKNN